MTMHGGNTAKGIAWRGLGKHRTAKVKMLRLPEEEMFGRSLDQRDGTTCAEVRTNSFWTTTPPLAQSRRSPDVSGWKIGRIADAERCMGSRSTAESSNHS